MIQGASVNGDRGPVRHVCVIHSSESEVATALLPFLREGLALGERMVVLVRAAHVPAVTRLVQEPTSGLGPLRDGQLRVEPVTGSAPESGPLSPEPVVQWIRTESRQARENGFTGLRLVREMSAGTSDPRQGCSIERLEGIRTGTKRIDDLLENENCRLMCLFDRKLDAGLLLDVIACHRSVAVGGELCENPAAASDDRAFGDDRNRLELDDRIAGLIAQARAMQSVQNSERRYRAVIQAQDDLIIRTSPDGRITFVNDAYARSWGKTPDELIDMDHDGLAPTPEYREAILAMETSLSRENPVHWVELCRRDAQGNERWTQWSVRALFDESGKFIERQGVGRDITPLKLAQRSLDLKNRIASILLTVDDEQMYGEVLAVVVGTLASEIGLFGYLNDEGSLVLPSLTRTVWDRCEMEGKSLVFPREIWGGIWGRSLVEGRSFLVNEPMTVPKGHLALRRAITVAIVFHGTVVGILAVANKATDYDERDLAAIEEIAAFVAPVLHFRLQRDRENFRRLAAEAESRELEAQVRQAQKLESLGVLAGGIAHDFNNLLMGVLGNAELALADIPTDSPARECLEGIERAARRAADLSRQMLAYSGRGPIAPAVVDISGVIRGMADLLGIAISKKICLELRLMDGLPRVRVDVSSIKQVVMNLVTNASEAIGEATGTITVSSGVIECDRTFLSSTYVDDQLPEGRYVFVRVTDTGCGMDVETRSRIFDPFFTTKFTGRGLGLAAALGIIRSHRGAIRVSSSPGNGATFVVLLPVPEQRQAQPAAAAARTVSPLKGSCILIADDEETIRLIGRRMLEKLGCTVAAAADGNQVLEEMKRPGRSIDCVLLDIGMPHMTGPDLIEKMREIVPGVPVILCTGFMAEEVVSRYQHLEKIGYLQKPYRQAELSERLESALRK